MNKSKVMLIIRDGYGKRNQKGDNAVDLANTPYTDWLMDNYPTTLLRTSGEDVGLPHGYMGGSEVGHMTIGTGRVNFQHLEMINRSIKSGEFFSNAAFSSLIDHAKENGKGIHLMGLLQNKGVHAHQDHLFALLKMCADRGISKEKVRIHIFSDGRDSPPQSLKEYVEELKSKINEYGVGVISSLVGRYYAMDRDTRWDRIEKAYDLLVDSIGEKFDSIDDAIDSSYSNGESDEFITPKVIGDHSGMYDGDICICYNYRTDRVRQLFHALTEFHFDGFTRKVKIDMIYGVMTKYYDDIHAKIAFENEVPQNSLGEVIASRGLKQLRISETEKYPHVTFFFNGQIDEPFSGEDRVLIPSPREVSTYDEKPEMSIYEIKDRLVEEMKKDYDLIVVNYVNGDMVGHTGKLDAAIKAVESVDICLKETIEKGLEKGYDIIVFADHGNCEEMSGEHQTSHTLNDVDCILVSSKEELNKDHIYLEYGGLKDVAPLALDLLGIEKPKDMNGESLIRQLER